MTAVHAVEQLLRARKVNCRGSIGDLASTIVQTALPHLNGEGSKNPTSSEAAKQEVVELRRRAARAELAADTYQLVLERLLATTPTPRNRMSALAVAIDDAREVLDDPFTSDPATGDR